MESKIANGLGISKKEYSAIMDIVSAAKIKTKDLEYSIEGNVKRLSYYTDYPLDRGISIGKFEVTIEDGKVTVLSIVNLKPAKLPESIGDLENLTRLDISYNRLSTLPESIGRLKNLKAIFALGNDFAMIPAHIMQLSNLENVNFKDNRIPEINKIRPDRIAEIFQAAKNAVRN